MHRTFSSVRRHTLNAALGMLLLVLAGCGTHGNPVAPIVTPSNQASTTMSKVTKHPNHANGVTRHDPQSSGSGAASGSMTEPWAGESDEPLVIE